MGIAIGLMILVASAPASDSVRASGSWTWEAAVVAATLLSPVIAVQVQKLLERRRAFRDRKEQVFEALMATRNAPLSTEHVRALNMIEVTFYGKGPGKRSATEDQVLDQWRYYLGFLSDVGAATQPLVEGGAHQSPQPHHFQRREELFVDLLASISKDLGYDYEKVNLKPAAGYSPASLNDAEGAKVRLIMTANEVLAGHRSIPVSVVQDVRE